MKKIIVLLVFVCISISVNAQQTNEEKAVQTAIEQFFQGIHKGNMQALEKTMNKEIKLQTTYRNTKGENILKTDDLENLMNFAKGIKPTDDYFEKILSYNIQIDGTLASAWTPYEFYNKGKFSHCGVNSFQLFNNNGNWEIIYLIDTRRRSDCKPTGK